MVIFFTLLILLAIYQVYTRKSVAKFFPQMDKKQTNRLTIIPFNFVGWTLLLAFGAFILSTLTSMFKELFDVDNYIGLLGRGWIGMIANSLRSSGFIGDIEEPAVLVRYQEIISLIRTVTFYSCCFCTISLMGFCEGLKKNEINGTALLVRLYVTMACGIVSFTSLMWGLWQFNELLNNAIIFHMEGVYWFLILTFIPSFIIAMILGKRALEQLIDIPRFRMMTWQTLFSKFKIQTNNTRTISETFILTTAICLSLLISGIVILNALPLDENAELAEQSYIENECETIVEEFPSENSYNQVNEYNKQRCISTLQKYYTASLSQIDEWGGQEAFETKRFIKYTYCWDSQVLTSNQDFGIGDDCLTIESIVPNSNIENSYIVTVKCGYSTPIPTCVVMIEENGDWKIDNIAYEPYEEEYIDYSKPANYYYLYDGCDEYPMEEDEDFIAL